MNEYYKILDEIRSLYLNDTRPWIIGFSGGKDSTCITQMVYYILQSIPLDKRTKEVHVLSSDTLVENPLMEVQRRKICEKIEKAAKIDRLPLKVKILKPELNDTFWVNLIGRGYPSPNRWFRWCTDRLKINPMTKYILEQVKESGEVIILLGVRKSESTKRAQTMEKYGIENFNLRKHANISGAFIYAPIENWEENDVWNYLLEVQSPWGENNEDLKRFYRKGDAEIQFMLDKNAPPGGSSRFGCWVCTVVDRDRSIEGSIEEGEAWLKPLLEFRNWLLKIRDDPKNRESTRKSEREKELIAKKLGREYIPQEHRGHKILGPFTFEIRHEILRRLIRLQEQTMGKGITLISPEEIKAIETIWIYEGDNISAIADVLDYLPFYQNTKRNGTLGLEQLGEICIKKGIPSRLIEQLLIVEKDLSHLSRRTGIYERLETVIGEYLINEMNF